MGYYLLVLFDIFRHFRKCGEAAYCVPWVGARQIRMVLRNVASWSGKHLGKHILLCIVAT